MFEEYELPKGIERELDEKNVFEEYEQQTRPKNCPDHVAFNEYLGRNDERSKEED